MGRWFKLGRLYDPEAKPRHFKLASHAANPLAVRMSGDVYRIFYSGRDAENRSSVGAVDVDIVRRKVLREHHAPFFVHGSTGSFFADGVSIGNCYDAGGVRYMLFMGWQSHTGQHWRGDIGRLVVTEDFSLRMDRPDPLLGADRMDPISLSYPWVQENPCGGYDMWYGSTLAWDAGNGEMLHVIHHASSVDGHVWRRSGLAVPYEIGLAQAFSHPTVFRDRCGLMTMWYSYRGVAKRTYRIGAAKSQNGSVWDLDLDGSGIDVSGSGWDSEMVAYPYVFEHGGDLYMLYNGNGFGKTGFGLAILDES